MPHTAGDWVLAEGNGTIYSADYTKTIVRVYGAGATEEEVANARLIAAAPKLVAALKACRHARDCTVNPGGPVMAVLGDPNPRPCSCGRDEAIRLAINGLGAGEYVLGDDTE